jgi:hypothetical protein
MIDVSGLSSNDSSLEWSSWYRGRAACRLVPPRRLVPCRLDLAVGQPRNREIFAADSSDSRVVNDQRDMGGRSRFILYQLSHKAIEGVVVGRRHAGIGDFDEGCFRFVASLDYGRRVSSQESVARMCQCPRFAHLNLTLLSAEMYRQCC